MNQKFRLRWTPSTADDVTKQEIVHTENSGAEIVEDVGVGTAEHILTVPEGVEVSWYNRTTDDADPANVSDSVIRTFTARDTFPPAPATDLSEEALGEVP